MNGPARKTALFYNAFLPFYPLVDAFFGPQKRALGKLLGALPPGRLLDLGCGDGSSFKAFGKHQVTGVDISPKMLAKARKRAPRNVILIEADIAYLPFKEDAFDYMVVSHVLATVADSGKVLAEAARVLKPGGKLFILNHFTPSGVLGLVDKAAQPLGRLFRFTSVFYEKELPLSTVFRKIHSQYWLGGYFGLLVYGKSLLPNLDGGCDPLYIC